MAETEWWQRGPVDGVPAVLQPVAHILLQVRESVGEMVAGLSETEWNARPAGDIAVACCFRPTVALGAAPLTRRPDAVSAAITPSA